MHDVMWRKPELGTAMPDPRDTRISELAGVYISIQRTLSPATAEVVADAELTDTILRRRQDGWEAGVWADELDEDVIEWAPDEGDA